MGGYPLSKKLPNIVFMVLDTVGAKHLSLYGYHRPTAPNLEQIAQESTVFTRCFAPACWTVPSHASMFTGLYPSQHGAHEEKYLLRDNLPHLVSILQATGYRTLGISANGLVSPATKICQDFDEFHDLGGGDLPLPHANTEGTSPRKTNDDGILWEKLHKAGGVNDALGIVARYLKETGRVAEVAKTGFELVARLNRKWLRPRPIDNATPYTRKTLSLVQDMLQRQKTESAPFFLFLNLFQAHQDYRPPIQERRFSRWNDWALVDPRNFYRRSPSPGLTELVEKYGNLYDDEILYLDSVVGSLWEMLRNTPFYDDTVVIITSDHGEHLGEKDHYTHILSLYNELLWVPLIVRFPPNLAAPRVDQRLASLNDLYATLLDAIDCPLPRPDSSFSLLAAPQREMAIAQCVYPEEWHQCLEAKKAVCRSQGETFSPPIFAVVTNGGLKLIGKRDGGLEVYNLKESMAEDRDLAPTLPPEALAEYHNLLEVLKAETGFHEATDNMLAQARQQSPAN